MLSSSSGLKTPLGYTRTQLSVTGDVTGTTPWTGGNYDLINCMGADGFIYFIGVDNRIYRLNTTTNVTTKICNNTTYNGYNAKTIAIADTGLIMISTDNYPVEYFTIGPYTGTLVTPVLAFTCTSAQGLALSPDGTTVYIQNRVTGWYTVPNTSWTGGAVTGTKVYPIGASVESWRGVQGRNGKWLNITDAVLQKFSYTSYVIPADFNTTNQVAIPGSFYGSVGSGDFDLDGTLITITCSSNNRVGPLVRMIPSTGATTDLSPGNTYSAATVLVHRPTRRIYVTINDGATIYVFTPYYTTAT